MNLDDLYISLANNTLTQDKPMPEQTETTHDDERAPAERILDPEYRAKLRKATEVVVPTEGASAVTMAADIVSLLDLVEALERQLSHVEVELHELASAVVGAE